MARLLLVSNRLPVTVKIERGRVSVAPSPGGLATGLAGPHQRSNGLWIGWPGDVSRLTPEQHTQVHAQLLARRTLPVYFTPAEANRFYENFSNGVLWPLFHYILEPLPMDPRDWEAYRLANERFADEVVRAYQPGDLIWVHDYQLMLVPALLRRKLPQARVGFFLHIPFPSSEIFRILPWRAEILDGLLGADLIGFHTFSYMRHFASSLLRVLGVEPDADSVWYGDRSIRLSAFPMGVDAAGIQVLAEGPELLAEVAAIKKDLGAQQLVVSVDRLDYTKGLRRRFIAVERLFEREPALRGRLRFVQVAVPSRTKVQAYREFRRQVDEQIGRINGIFGTASWVPVHYLYRALNQKQVTTLYRAADVMMVTPLRDGMNLVAKEFVASRADERGVLILSEFAGAAADLGEAIQVNPYDIDRVVDTLIAALRMPADEQRQRMQAMRGRVAAYDVHRWAESFIETLAAVRDSHAVVLEASPQESKRLMQRVRAAPYLALILDYDGTLVPFARQPELALPEKQLLGLLEALAGRANTEVHVVSGRSRETLEKWLGHLPVDLHAEHGYWTRPAAAHEWLSARALPIDWKAKVRPILDNYASRTPGSFIEEKSSALAWHYRRADPEFGAIQAQQLRLDLSELLNHTPVQILPGHKVVEVRSLGVHKGAVVAPILKAAPKDALIVAMGDDRTDEDLFASLPENGVAIHVGPSPSRALYRLSQVSATLLFLRDILIAEETTPGARPSQ